jgi:hypothetical protein
LASGIPDLQFNLLFTDCKIVQFEVNADGCEVFVFKGALEKAVDER